MRGPGCCLGSCLGLVLGAMMALALVVAAARWVPERLESAVRWVAGGGKPAAAEGPARSERAAAQPGEDGLRRQARHRLRRARASDREGGVLLRPVEISPEEVQALATDPEGPLGGRPRGLRVQLLDGRVSLSWKVSPVDWPQWLAERISVPMEVTLEPRLEDGRVALPVSGARAAGLRLPEWAAGWLAARLPAAPTLESLGAEARLPGLGRIEVHPEGLILHPASLPPASERR